VFPGAIEWAQGQARALLDPKKREQMLPLVAWQYRALRNLRGSDKELYTATGQLATAIIKARATKEKEASDKRREAMKDYVRKQRRRETYRHSQAGRDAASKRAINKMRESMKSGKSVELFSKPAESASKGRMAGAEDMLLPTYNSAGVAREHNVQDDPALGRSGRPWRKRGAGVGEMLHPESLDPEAYHKVTMVKTEDFLLGKSYERKTAPRKANAGDAKVAFSIPKKAKAPVNYAKEIREAQYQRPRSLSAIDNMLGHRRSHTPEEFDSILKDSKSAPNPQL
jgi:hypothetical protein